MIITPETPPLSRRRVLQLAGLSGIAAFGTLWSPLAPARAVAIPLYTLTYEVKYRGTSLGEMVITTGQQGNSVTVTGETFPEGVALLLGDGKYKEIIEYQQTESGLKLIQITKLQGKDFGHKRTARVSPDRRQIHLSQGSKTLDIRPGEHIDADTFPFVSILQADRIAAGREERAVSDKRVRSYIYETTTSETVSVPAGQFDTFKTRKRQKGGDKTITVWITQGAPRFPVIIEVSKKGKTDTRLSLVKEEIRS